LRINPGAGDQASIDDLIAQVQEVGRPKAVYKTAYIEEKGPDSITLDGRPFTSPALRNNLDKVERVFPYIATCGVEANRIPVDPEDILKKYWFRTLKLILLRLGVQYLRDHIQNRTHIKNLSAMNPGSGEASVWPIEQQQVLFEYFGDPETLIGVRLTPSYLMIPDMSVSGFLFPSESTYHNCQLCQREECPGRKAPFDPALWEKVNHSNHP